MSVQYQLNRSGYDGKNEARRRKWCKRNMNRLLRRIRKRTDSSEPVVRRYREWE